MIKELLCEASRREEVLPLKYKEVTAVLLNSRNIKNKKIKEQEVTTKKQLLKYK